jgi:hypothetical protein
MRPPDETLQVVHHHHQKYNSSKGGSCAASGVEMILKLEDQVPGSFYELQDHYKYENTGFGVFHNQTIKGLTFKSQRLPWADSSLTRLLHGELDAGRYSLISLLTGGWHIFVVFRYDASDTITVSKGIPPGPNVTEPLIFNIRAGLRQFFEAFSEFDVLTYVRA